MSLEISQQKINELSTKPGEVIVLIQGLSSLKESTEVATFFELWKGKFERQRTHLPLQTSLLRSVVLESDSLPLVYSAFIKFSVSAVAWHMYTFHLHQLKFRSLAKKKTGRGWRRRNNHGHNGQLIHSVGVRDMNLVSKPDGFSKASKYSKLYALYAI